LSVKCSQFYRSPFRSASGRFIYLFCLLLVCNVWTP
jgi:hypothetical protein